jgi:hypothetical protein
MGDATAQYELTICGGVETLAQAVTPIRVIHDNSAVRQVTLTFSFIGCFLLCFLTPLPAQLVSLPCSP